MMKVPEEKNINVPELNSKSKKNGMTIDDLKARLSEEKRKTDQMISDWYEYKAKIMAEEKLYN